MGQTAPQPWGRLMMELELERRNGKLLKKPGKAYKVLMERASLELGGGKFYKAAFLIYKPIIEACLEKAIEMV